MGRIVEVYQSPNTDPQTQSPLIVGIQDLHTNPEAELNLAKILDILLKDYKMGLVCSEGADGVVDTSSISSFPDARIKEKVSRIFIDSGELTGEEYLSITKYPDLPIWGVEDKDIYFKNILDFNKIMKFNPNSQVFISQTKKAVGELKPKIYSKDLIELDKKELEFNSQKLDTAKYLECLLDIRHRVSPSATHGVGFGQSYNNIALLKETMETEKRIDQSKIMTESSNLILNLQSILMNQNLKSDLDNLKTRANLFNEQKMSPFSFYSYLKDLALKHIKEIASDVESVSSPRNDNPNSVIARSTAGATKQSQGFAAKYPELDKFIDYLTKINSLDSTKLFLELENLNFEIKETIAKTDEQKLLIKASRNINFLENFFKLKVSNEDLDYYINNREEHKVSFFKDFLSPTIKKYNINTFIDYNPALIDSHLQELEDFYKTVKDRDIAMVKNSLSEIEKRNVKLASLVHGGFHTKGITKLLREKGYSYIIVSPYSKTDMDEENYHFLLQGRRKPITELLQKLDLSKIIENLMSSPRTLRVTMGLAKETNDALRKEKIYEQIRAIWGLPEAQEVTAQSLEERMGIALALADRRDWEGAIAKINEVRNAGEGAVIIEAINTKSSEILYFCLKANPNEAKLVDVEQFNGAKSIWSATVAAAAPARKAKTEAVSASTDTPMPGGLQYMIKQSTLPYGHDPVLIYSSNLKRFLDPDADKAKIESLGLIEQYEETLEGLMFQVFRVGSEQINKLDDERRIKLLRGLHALFERTGKEDVAFYVTSDEVVGEGVYMRKVKIKETGKYAVLINRKYFDAVNNAVEKIKSSASMREASMIDAVYYTVFERVMHELLENETLLEEALSSSLGHPQKGEAIKEAVIKVEIMSFVDIDARLYAYLCHGKMAGAIDLAIHLLKKGSENDRELARTIFGPHRYGKLAALFDRAVEDFGLDSVGLLSNRTVLARLNNIAPLFVNQTYTGASTTAMADATTTDPTAGALAYLEGNNQPQLQVFLGQDATESVTIQELTVRILVENGYVGATEEGKFYLLNSSHKLTPGYIEVMRLVPSKALAAFQRVANKREGIKFVTADILATAKTMASLVFAFTAAVYVGQSDLNAVTTARDVKMADIEPLLIRLYQALPERGRVGLVIPRGKMVIDVLAEFLERPAIPLDASYDTNFAPDYLVEGKDGIEGALNRADDNGVILTFVNNTIEVSFTDKDGEEQKYLLQSVSDLSIALGVYTLFTHEKIKGVDRIEIPQYATKQGIGHIITNVARYEIPRTVIRKTKDMLSDLLTNVEPQSQNLSVENAFVIRADKMQQANLDPMQWLEKNRNAHLVILINSVAEYKAVAEKVINLEQEIDERLHLVVFVGEGGLSENEVTENKIDRKDEYLQDLFRKVSDYNTPVSVSAVVGDLARAEETITAI